MEAFNQCYWVKNPPPQLRQLLLVCFCLLGSGVIHAQSGNPEQTTSDATQNSSSAKPVALSAECAQLTQDTTIDLKKVVQAGCKPSQEQISKMMDNPVGNLAFLVMQNDYTMIKGPGTGGYKSMDRFQLIPTFPIKVSNDWNLINRISIPFVSAPVKSSAGQLFGMSPTEIVQSPSALSTVENPFGRTNGLGDLAYVGLLSPAKPYKTDDGGMIVWGAGVAAAFPTASEDVLGQGKYSAGPTGVVAYMGKDWSLGLFPQQFWSYAGNGNRASVNATNIQYFIFRNLGWNWRIGMSPNITVDWNAAGGQKVTLPVGLGASYMFKLGEMPIRVGMEAQYSVIYPDNIAGSRWNFRFLIVPVIPTFLF